MELVRVNIINTSIKFNMSLKTVQPTFTRRTSQRRRLKMLRNLDQYKINNPFKSQRQIPDLPDDLAKQLKKVEYLSATSISLISFPTAPLQTHNHQSNLSQMREAILSQQNRMLQITGEQENMEPQNPEGMEQEEVSLVLQEGHCAGEEVITTRQQLSINFLHFQDHYIPPEDFQEEDLNMLESQPHSQYFKQANVHQDDHLIMDEDYQRYFQN